MELEFLLVIIYLNTLLIFILANLTIYVKKNLNVIRNGKAYYADSRDKTLFYSIHRLNHFPINFKITKYDWRIYAKSKKEKVKPQT